MSPQSSPDDQDPTEIFATRHLDPAGASKRETETDTADLEPSVDPLDELLVSYLDGELNEQERSALEDRLINEVKLRARLTELQSGWEMLDALPPANVTEDFARTTVELVAARESRMIQAQRARKPWKRIGWISAVTLATVACGLGGYAIPVQVQRQEYLAQLELLPLAEHLDAYLVDIELELVEQLAADPTWQESMQLAIEAGGITNLPSLDLAQREPEKRLQVIEDAGRYSRVNLSTNWDRLKSLNDQRLSQVRQRAEMIHDTQRPSVILTTLEQYARWWQQLAPTTQDQIIKASGEEKLETIRREVRRSSRRWVRNFAMTLGDTDRIPIHQQLLMIANDRIQAAKEQAELTMSKEGDFEPHRIPWWGIKPENLLDAMANRPNFPGPQTDRRDGGELNPFSIMFGPFSNDELESIEDLLSRQALAILYGESDSDVQRRETLTDWCMEIVQQMSSGSNGFEALLSRYNLSDEERRESLDLSMPDRMIHELRGRRGRSSRRGR